MRKAINLPWFAAVVFLTLGMLFHNWYVMAASVTWALLAIAWAVNEK